MIPRALVAHALTPLLVAPASRVGNGAGGKGIANYGHVRYDSRRIEPGDLFVALPGERSDGHQYVADAIARGAAGVIVSPQRLPADALSGAANVDMYAVTDTLKALHTLAAAWRASLTGLTVVGVTGSVGKTSTKEVIAAVLAQRSPTHKNTGNLNNEIGMPATLLEITPDHRYAVLEMGMYGLGEIALLAELARPQVGVVTVVHPVHLERLGTMERIQEAKAELPRALPPGGTAILNGDDPRVRQMQQWTAARVVLYGTSDDCAVRATDIVPAGLAGFSFRLHYQGDARAVRVKLRGVHHVTTCLAAAAVGFSQGMAWDDVVCGLETADDEVRTIVRPGLRGTTIIDDCYNASPGSVLAALDLLARSPGRRIAVLGDMYELGAAEHEGHAQVGRRAATAADVLVAVGRLGRLIADAAQRAGARRVAWTATNDAAAALLRDELARGDTVLVKGSRGMAMERIVERIVAEAEATPVL